ncbi:MAG TPA: hypothetical protein VMU85_20805 [Stellaceae bacterium]|nr:hypothetical protein [Stellaceae bacterium]
MIAAKHSESARLMNFALSLCGGVVTAFIVLVVANYVVLGVVGTDVVATLRSQDSSELARGASLMIVLVSAVLAIAVAAGIRSRLESRSSKQSA